ncbi:MAG: hypothetical protein M0Z52_01315 [Actinomycetota bacterium]|nr:hypothetical protein [Actinomycetota bacterium]
MDGKTTIQVIERSIKLKMIEIKLPGRNGPYWVPADSLAPLK